MHILPEADAAPAITPFQRDRRLNERVQANQSVWLVDHSGETVLPCRCVDVSETGMRLRAPLGYGLATGQRYELRASLPGGHSRRLPGIFENRWATIVRTRIHIGSTDEYLDVGAVLELGQ